MRTALSAGIFLAVLLGPLLFVQKANAPGYRVLVEEPPIVQEKTVTPTTAPAQEVFYHEAFATVFWVGEGMTLENGFIANSESAWDSHWEEHFGGVDDPFERCRYHPCAFVPKENPFYVALPYDDLDWRGRQKDSARAIPWYSPGEGGESLLKNRWVEVRFEDRACFGQWEDVGPFETDDFEYVFGSSSPRNIFGVSAGIDLSPALRDCLHMEDNAVVLWRFIEDTEVPQGPWREIITTSGVVR